MDYGVSLYDLIHGKYAALVIRGFCNEDYCRTISKRIFDISVYDYGTGVVKKVGIFLMAYVTRKDDYFSNAISAEEQFQKIFYDVEHPRSRICHVPTHFIPARKVMVAEDDGHRYSAGIIRVHESGDLAPLHKDNAAADAIGFSVAHFKHQLSCVLCIQHAENGGELVIYDRLWKLADEKFRDVGFGYSRKVIADNVRRAAVRAKTGDLLIINPKNFHEILPVSGRVPRITFGLFVGLNDDGTAVVWS